jgi:hypothetical protein
LLSKPEEILDRISTMQTELKATQKQLETVKGELATAKSEQLLSRRSAAVAAVGDRIWLRLGDGMLVR